MTAHFIPLGLAVCGGGGSCGSCNVILPQDLFDALPPAKEQEAELLNTVVFGRKPTLMCCQGVTNRSRLACCVKISEKFAGKTIEVPLPLLCFLDKRVEQSLAYSTV